MNPNNLPSQALKSFEIFRPGTFTAMSGTQHSFSAAQVAEMVETYNPSFSDAPLVVGHPKLTSPRFGHVGKLFVNDKGVLCAEAADVVPAFAEAVNAKHYPKVSASIFLPNAPGNPTPGKHYLRHVGFLGGVAPAVKGLASVEFSASDDGVVEFAYQDRLVVRFFRQLRNLLAEKFGAEEADKALPPDELDWMAEAAIREEYATAEAQPAFSQPAPNKEDTLSTEAARATIKSQEDALAARQAELDARDAELNKRELAATKGEHAEFAEALCADGKLLPAHKNQVVEILSQLSSLDQVADFADGDPDHGKTGAELFKALLGAQPKLVEFKRVSDPRHDATGSADFAAPFGETVDSEGMEVLAKAQQYMAANPGTSFIQAVEHVQAS